MYLSDQEKGLYKKNGVFLNPVFEYRHHADQQVRFLELAHNHLLWLL